MENPNSRKKYSKNDIGLLYQEYYEAIYGFVLSYVKSSNAAEDITQDLFVKLIERGDEDLYIEHVKSYFFTAAKNRALNYLKRVNKETEVKSELYKDYEKLHISLDDEIANVEYQKLLDKYLSHLTTQNNAVFKLCRDEGKSYKEAAEELGISESAVKKHMVKSMKIISSLLKKDFGLFLILLLNL